MRRENPRPEFDVRKATFFATRRSFSPTYKVHGFPSLLLSPIPCLPRVSLPSHLYKVGRHLHYAASENSIDSTVRSLTGSLPTPGHKYDPPPPPPPPRSRSSFVCPYQDPDLDDLRRGVDNTYPHLALVTKAVCNAINIQSHNGSRIPQDQYEWVCFKPNVEPYRYPEHHMPTTYEQHMFCCRDNTTSYISFGSRPQVLSPLWMSG